LRCLFIKYLEDRKIFDKNYLLSILESNNPERLKEAFENIAKINGDVFKYDIFDFSELQHYYLDKLALFFKSDYRSSQLQLFPYKFDEIPIQLISHVYEAFLKGSEKKGKGIYYTPSFLVKFMLSKPFAKQVHENPYATILDPAVGSGAFLVEAFKMIQKEHGKQLDFDSKKQILENQLFGIDVDPKALQIAAFSLYLALLETEDPTFIRAEIERANPILPSLIGKTLICGNSIYEDIFPSKTFDCIASNPPWGSVPTGNNKVDLKERSAIDTDKGEFPEYQNVADYERSQAFLTRVSKWGGEHTTYTMVVKNSIFLNDKAKNFRQDFLNRYTIDTFYELSNYNKILFKKTVIGKINGKKIEIGASEPCVVIHFKSNVEESNFLNYISPKLSAFAEQLEIIHYTSQDSHRLEQSEFTKKDSLWKVLVNSDVEAHDLIVDKIQWQKNLMIEARVGLQPQKLMPPLGAPIFKEILDPSDFEQFYLKNKQINHFDWNRKLRRKSSLNTFRGEKLIIPVRPLKSDHFLFRGIYLEKEMVFKDNIVAIKFKDDTGYIKNYLPYLGVLNSQLIGFLFFQLSIQWGKGEGKRDDALRNIDVERLPIKKINDISVNNELTRLVEKIQKKKELKENTDFEIHLLNEKIFDLYKLTNYEREIIQEFYQINVERADKASSLVRDSDITTYFKVFKDAFSLILSEENTLNATYYISPNLGAIISISIVEKFQSQALKTDNSLSILNFVKSKQMNAEDSLQILFEDKVKLYDKNSFYIIKSNQFKDWTVRQAMKDAKEEMNLFINQLPVVNG